MPVGNSGTVPVEARSAGYPHCWDPQSLAPGGRLLLHHFSATGTGKATFLDLESLGLGHFWLVLEPRLLLCLEQLPTHLEGLLMEK